jgi:hypothetical protein
MLASAPDLALFGDAVLHSPLISSETRELLFRPVTLDDGSSTGSHFYEVAFGWRVGKDAAGRRVYHHAGVTQGARSVLVLYPDAGLSIAFLSNASWTAQIERTAFALANLVLDRQQPNTSDSGSRFTGTFDGQAIAGSLDCDDEFASCRLSDNGGSFSAWLNQYRPGAGNDSWPVFPFQGERGRLLKTVTSVGLIELREVPGSATGHFEAEIGNGRRLDVQFRPSDR